MTPSLHPHTRDTPEAQKYKRPNRFHHETDSTQTQSGRPSLYSPSENKKHETDVMHPHRAPRARRNKEKRMRGETKQPEEHDMHNKNSS
jgi:hypothetical protein